MKNTMKAAHDVHIHNYLSDCCHDMQATVENYINIERANGVRLMGFANHAWDESIPLPDTKSWGVDMYRKHVMAFEMQIKPQIPKDTGELKVLVGAETEYCGMFDVLGMGKEAALTLDFLLIPHTHVHMTDFVMPAPPSKQVEDARRRLESLLAQVEGIIPERAAKWASRMSVGELEYYMVGEADNEAVAKFISDFMVESFRGLMNNEMLKSYSNLIPVSVAHPFQPVGYGHIRTAAQAMIPDNTYGELFSVAAARGIGLEINCATNDEESFRLYGIARECGCKFTLGTDAHSRAALSALDRTQALIDRLALTEYDMMDFVRV